jgi:putative FmdB family regulatory protein
LALDVPECQITGRGEEAAVPTYQYACTECAHQLEAVQSFTDDALTECPECAGRLRKLYSAVGIVFKGSGFYRNDSRPNGGEKAEAKPGAEKSGAEKSGSTSGGDAAGSTSSGGASGPASSGSSGDSGGSSASGSGAAGSRPSGSARSAEGGPSRSSGTSSPAKAGSAA